MSEQTLIENGASFHRMMRAGVTKDHPDVILFYCPVCNPTHGIMVSWEPPTLFPDPDKGGDGPVWNKVSPGMDLANFELNQSINCDVPHKVRDPVTNQVIKEIPSSCKFHGWVQQGKVRW
jgi:hypothetical protein